MKKRMQFNRVLLVFIMVFFCCETAQAENYFFPKQQISLGFYDNEFITANPWRPSSPFFWSASTKADGGGTLVYTRMLYHSQKYFSAEWGVAGSVWTMNGQSSIAAFSALIQLRWWLFRTDYFNPYLVYSVAGPTLLTRDYFGNANLTAPFIFQDYLGAGAFFGKDHHFDLSARMYHYSNGDLLTHNPGFDVPLVIFFGFNF